MPTICGGQIGDGCAAGSDGAVWTSAAVLKTRTQCYNSIRAHLSERGLSVGRSRSRLDGVSVRARQVEHTAESLATGIGADERERIDLESNAAGCDHVYWY